MSMSVFHRSVRACVAAISLLLLASSADAGVIFRDNFDEENGGVPFVGSGGENPPLSNWEITGQVDLITAPTPFGFDPAPAGGLYIDLSGSGAKGRMETGEFDLTPGLYKLDFFLAGSQIPDDLARGDNEFSEVLVKLGNVYSETFTLQRSVPFTYFARKIKIRPKFSGTLSFEHTFGDNFAGPLLDEVRLKVVPEPSSLSLFSIGILGMLGCRWRRKRAA